MPSAPGPSISTSPKTTAPCTAPAPTTKPAATASPTIPNGKLDIAKCSTFWLKDAAARGIKHICWDGCMFPNEVLEKAETWEHILKAMVEVDEAL